MYAVLSYTPQKISHVLYFTGALQICQNVRKYYEIVVQKSFVQLFLKRAEYIAFYYHTQLSHQSGRRSNKVGCWCIIFNIFSTLHRKINFCIFPKFSAYNNKTSFQVFWPEYGLDILLFEIVLFCLPEVHSSLLYIILF